jgi:hypothetical protein
VAAVVTLVVPMAGCGDCAEPGPNLGSTDDGEPAVGWEDDGSVRVRSVAFKVGGADRWRIEASEPADPSVLVLGEDAPGYLTTVAAIEPIGPDTRGVVVVEYALDGAPRRSEITMSYLGGSAEVTDYECGSVARWFAIFSLQALLVVAGVLIVLVFLVGGGAVLLLTLVRNVVRSRQ